MKNKINKLIKKYNKIYIKENNENNESEEK